MNKLQYFSIALLMFLVIGCSDVPKEKIINDQLTYFKEYKQYFLVKDEWETKKCFIRSEPQIIPELGIRIALVERGGEGLLFSVFIPTDAEVKPGDEVELFEFILRRDRYQRSAIFLVAKPK